MTDPITKMNALVPVYGPPNWNSWHSVASRGNDLSLEAPEDDEPPLLDEQLKQLNSSIIRSVQFVKKIGEGGFGQVYEVNVLLNVKESQIQETVWKRFRLAMKVIRQTSAKTEHIEESLAEMKSLRFIRHENICNFIEIIGISDRITGFPYSIVCLFFELCDNDMREFVKVWQNCRPPNFVGAWTWSEEISRHWFAQIARALEYIHSIGIVHNDMNIRNIFYRFISYSVVNTFDDYFLTSVFKLGDFGESVDTTTNFEYSPKKFEAQKREDINSLGKILYYTGQVDQTNWQSKQITPQMKDLLDSMDTNNITMAQVLIHPWLQCNIDPRTERFIYRDSTPQYSIQMAYHNWQDVRNFPHDYPYYAPFGGVPSRRFVKETQEWQDTIIPIQGAATLLDFTPE